MIHLDAICVANGAAIFLLGIVMFSSRKTIELRLPDQRMFHIMVACAILESIAETVTFLLDGRAGAGMRVLLLIVNALSYIINILFAFSWTLYAEYKLFPDGARVRQIYSVLAIPAALVTVGSLVNLFTPVFFRLTPDNVYQRTDFFIIPYIFTYFYLAFGVALIIRNRHKGSRYLFLPTALFMIPILVGSLLQFFLYGYSLVWIGTAIALTSLYISIQNETTCVDTLSGTYTRLYMSCYLDSETHRSGPKQLAGILLDIDSFKSINDRFGHLTGDEAIRCTGKILRTCTPPSGIAARFAGDEFVLLFPVEREDEVQTVVKRIIDCTETFNHTVRQPFELQFSMGYGLFDRQADTSDSFLDRIDRAMYVEKIQKKQDYVR